MDHANLFLKHSTGIQVEVINALLDEFENHVSNMKGTVMDVGCGPGNNTRNHILPKLPKDAVMIGFDVSKNMVDTARALNAEETRLMFEELNIETPNLPVEYIGKINHGISFFCLHWMEDLRRAFRNIYEMLTPGGTFLSQHILLFNGYNCYLRLAKYPQYAEYMKDAKRFITSLYFDETPRATLTKMLQEVGFEVLHCSVREKVSGNSSQQARKELFEAVNPFVSRMPKDLQEKFMTDLMKETLKEKTVLFRKNEDNEGEDIIFDVYKLIMLHLKKPGN